VQSDVSIQSSPRFGGIDFELRDPLKITQARPGSSPAFSGAVITDGAPAYAAGDDCRSPLCRGSNAAIARLAWPAVGKTIGSAVPKNKSATSLKMLLQLSCSYRLTGDRITYNLTAALPQSESPDLTMLERAPPLLKCGV
jgi:hypothetical protein